MLRGYSSQSTAFSLVACSALLVLDTGARSFADAPHGASDATRIAPSRIAFAPAALEVSPRGTAILTSRDDGRSELLISVAGATVSMRLVPHSVRDSHHFGVFAVDADGRRQPVNVAAPTTVRGSATDGSGAHFAGAFTSDELTGIVTFADGTRYLVEPAPSALGAHMVRPMPTEIPFGACGVETADGGVAGDAPSNPPTDHFCIAQLGCDADFEYFEKWGGVDGVVARIELITNIVNEQFESEVGLSHQLTTILVRTTPGLPYDSIVAATLLGQFQTEWNTTHAGIERDVAKLFTGKDLASAIVGLAADTGLLCNVGQAYCLVQSDYANDLACATDLSAHELGHLWGASHCSCSFPPSTMNPNIVCANTFHASPSPAEILAYMQNIACLECTTFDCNGNGIGDFTEISQGASQDCNDNNIPDECERADGSATDCDGDGVLDACQIAADPGVDCTQNGVLDVCDIASGQAVDIDGNGIPDQCDPDCNANGVLDGLDILVGTSFDCNADFVPDECQTDGPQSAPTWINDTALTDPGIDDASAALVAGNAEWIVAWTRSGGAWGDDGEIMVARSVDQGRSWSEALQVSPGGFGNVGLDAAPVGVATGPSSFALVWSSRATLDGTGTTPMPEIVFATTSDGGATWSSPSYVVPGATNDGRSETQPSLGIHADGSMVAVFESWTNVMDRDIRGARSPDRGITWLGPTIVQSTGAVDTQTDDGPTIAVNASGRWLAAWNSRNVLGSGLPLAGDYDIHSAWSDDGGATWSTVAAINSDALLDQESDVDVTLRVDAAGAFVAMWSARGGADPGGSAFEIVFRRSADGVAWSPMRVLFPPFGADALSPALARIGTEWRVVWRVNGGLAPYGNDQDVFYSVSLDDMETWSPLQPVLADADNDGSGVDTDPTIAADDHVMTLAWTKSLGSTSDLDLVRVVMVYPDCNENEVDDACELAVGATPDANKNGVPDECESPSADLNGDGAVNAADLGILLGAWGSGPSSADLVVNGVVDAEDLAFLLGAWAPR